MKQENDTYQNIINELNKYYNKDNKHNLFSKSLYDQTKKILSLINNQNYKHEAEKNLMLEDTWEILRQNRECGFTFDNSPSISDTESSPALHYLEHNDNKSINYHPLKNQNHLIIGENFYALQNMLLAGYREKIDIIYIDPPYNTKTMKSYADKFGRDGWLSMMYERLKLAKKLLKEDGVIFISIDDNEQAYLKVIMDEIFGENHFLNNFIWISNKKGRQTTKTVANTYEYIMAFTYNCAKYKKISTSYIQKEMSAIYEPKEYKIFKNKDNREYVLKNELKQTNMSQYSVVERPNLRFPIYINFIAEKNFKFSVDKPFNNLSKFLEIWPVPSRATWRWSKEKVKNENQDLEYVLSENKIYTKNYSFRETKIKDVILGKGFTTKSGTSELDSLNITEFKHPKPTSIIKFLINLVSSKESLILDFFAGTGTTGHAVMDLNKKDCGNRKFILATNNEFIKDENGKNTDNRIGDLCYERLHRIIKGESTKEERNFPWLKKHKPYSNESLNYYEIKELSVSLDKSTPESNKTDSMINSLNEAYKYLNNDFETLDYLQINKNNWFNKLYPLLTNANVALQDKNTKT